MSRVAAIQLCSGADLAANLQRAAAQLAIAAADGVELAVLPENFAFLGEHERDKLAIAETPGEGPQQAFLAQQAVQHGMWIVGGTIPLRSAVRDRVTQSCLVYNAQGQQVARYDKIHLFDVDIEASGEQYRESAAHLPGIDACVIDTPVGRLGLSICYDLRFPEFYRLLIDQHAELIVVPSAFTRVTGSAHWELLLRARAIENSAYVVAAAQEGEHPGGRETYGHSMIIDPWGLVLNCLEHGLGVVASTLDMQRVTQIRETFPSVTHRRVRCALDRS